MPKIPHEFADQEPTLNHATGMTQGVHSLQAPDAGAAGQVRGKYKSVPTSSSAFMEQKSEELRLEYQ